MANQTTQPPATAMESQAQQGSGAPLALQRVGANARNQIKVSSPAIHGTISKMQSEYGDGVSPELWWERVEGAKVFGTGEVSGHKNTEFPLSGTLSGNQLTYGKTTLTIDGNHMTGKGQSMDISLTKE